MKISGPPTAQAALQSCLAIPAPSALSAALRAELTDLAEGVVVEDLELRYGARRSSQSRRASTTEMLGRMIIYSTTIINIYIKNNITHLLLYNINYYCSIINYILLLQLNLALHSSRIKC